MGCISVDLCGERNKMEVEAATPRQLRKYSRVRRLLARCVLPGSPCPASATVSLEDVLAVCSILLEKRERARMRAPETFPTTCDGCECAA